VVTDCELFASLGSLKSVWLIIDDGYRFKLMEHYILLFLLLQFHCANVYQYMRCNLLHLIPKAALCVCQLRPWARIHEET